MLHVAPFPHPNDSSDPADDAGLHVSVLGSFGFAAADGSHPALAGGSQRLLAFLALHTEGVTHGTAAGLLWPDTSDDHASSSLRSALSRLGSMTRVAVTATDTELKLADGVYVDIRRSQDLAHLILQPCASDTQVDARSLSELSASERSRSALTVSARSISALSQDLLPDWYDDWVVPEAEEWRQLRLHALEALSAKLAAVGRFAHAIGAALAAVRVDPLRESANAAVIRVHLAEGNQADALREFRRYRALLQRELGVEPTDSLFELVGVAPSASRRSADTWADGPKWAEVRVARRHR